MACPFFSQGFNPARLRLFPATGVGAGSILTSLPLGTDGGGHFHTMPKRGIQMGRPRTPAAIARITGADRLHPGRHASRSEPSVRPIGPPPERLTDAERGAWLALVADMPWLGRSDRALVELTARLKVITSEPDAPLAAYTQLRLCLASMGGTPVDRSKIAAPDEDTDDPGAEFFQ